MSETDQSVATDADIGAAVVESAAAPASEGCDGEGDGPNDSPEADGERQEEDAGAGTSGPSLDAEVVQMLSAPSSEQRLQDFDKVLARGQAAVPTLLALVAGRAGMAPGSDEERHAVELAVEALGMLRERSAIEPLIERLRTCEPEGPIGLAIAFALSEMGPPALPALLAAYDASDELGYRLLLCEPLARLRVRDPRIFDILLACLPHRLQDVSEYLADYGDRRAVAHLVRALDTYEPEAAEDPKTAAAVLYGLAAALDRFEVPLTEAQKAKCQRFYAPAGESDDAPRERRRRRRDRRKRSRRKQQKASRRKNGYSLYCS